MRIWEGDCFVSPAAGLTMTEEIGRVITEHGIRNTEHETWNLK